MEIPITIVYREDSAPYALSPHHHTSHELIYLSAGRATFRIGDNRYDAKAGDLLLISNLEPHDLEVVEWPYHRHYVLIQPDTLHTVLREPELEALFRYRPAHFRHVVSLNPVEAERALALLTFMVEEERNKRSFWQGCLENGLRTLLIDLYRNHPALSPQQAMPGTARIMLEIQRYIDRHDHEDLRLDAVAKLFHFDMYHLSHQFRKTTGYSFKEYLIRRRISRATDRLRNTTDPIAQVSEACGFHSVPHFIRTFRRITETTPLQYRKRG